MNFFQKLKVIEFASVLAGPAVGQFFAELGATVIKIENPLTGGDVTRSWKSKDEQTDDRSAYFCAVNWGKQSVTLDLRDPAHLAIAYNLLRDADIMISSFKPGDDVKLKLDYKTIQALNPRLLYGHITGYGSSNPRVGYDAVIQAESGFMYMNGSPGGPSLKMPVALMDLLAAHQLKEALLIALIEREETSAGTYVGISLIQSAVSSLANQATNYLVGGLNPGKQGSAHPNIAPYGDVYITNDNKEVILAIGTDQQFKDLCVLLDLPLIARDETYAHNHGRIRHRASLNQALQSAIGGWDADKLVTRLNDVKIPAGIIQSVPQVMEMLEAKQMIFEGEQLRGIRSFVGGPRVATLSEPPHLGQHNHLVFHP